MQEKNLLSIKHVLSLCRTSPCLADTAAQAGAFHTHTMATLPGMPYYGSTHGQGAETYCFFTGIILGDRVRKTVHFASEGSQTGAHASAWAGMHLLARLLDFTAHDEFVQDEVYLPRATL